jgi:exodeoxyribonuclease V beta subunit
MTAPHIEAVDLRGPLPTGTVVLEASAGTGKTYTIAGLVTRYVAEGHARIDQVLAVTFGRAATGELRTRVRERLVEARDALADQQRARRSGDPVIALLADAAPDAVDASRTRLTSALAGFDAATVATTHEFCHQVLHFLGTSADLDPGTVLVESLDDIVREACDDLYLAFSTRAGAAKLPFSATDALAVARAAVGDPQAALLPRHADRDSEADLRVRFATAVRREVDRRKRRLRILGFDDLLGRVRDALADDVTGPVACERLRSRYRVVLVDEFQDTDPVQWDVLRLAFHGHRDLVVIGDPKQAIYAFRGADVRAYLTAKTAATTHQTLDTNWRSDTRLVDGLTTLFRGAALGTPRSSYGPVAAAYADAAVGPSADDAPVRLRVLARDGFSLTQKQEVPVTSAREAVARDVASQVVETLRGGHTYTPRGGSAGPLTARHIAVLVRTGVQARMVRTALLDVGVPCVLTGTSSVFATAAARDWVVLLEALEQSHRSARVRRLALTSFVGMTAADIDAGRDALTDQLTQQVRGWSDVLAERGVAALFAAVQEQTELAARLLRRTDGERLVTDLRHVAESLHGEALSAQLGPAGLLSWLRARVEEAEGDADQERSRRLDTDADAVQVATVHTSKGLEFPVVLVPFGWDSTGGGRAARLSRGHDEDGHRTLHVGGQGSPGYAAACAEQDDEEAGEELRLLYVAATRAISRLVLWWAPARNTARGPLHRLLFAADPAATPRSCPVPATPPRSTGCATSRVPPRRHRRRRHAVERAHARAGASRRPYGRLTARGRLRPHGRPALAAHLVHRPDRPGHTTTGRWSARSPRWPPRTTRPTSTRCVAPTSVPALAPASIPACMARDEALKAIRRRWLTCPAAGRSARWCTPVLEEADLRAAGDLREELRAVAQRQLARRGGALPPTSSPTRCCRSSGRRSSEVSGSWTSTGATGCPSWTSSCRSRAGTGRSGR